MLRVLVVCTGNLCRSPLAAAALGARLCESGVPARVGSAGLVTEDQSSPRELLVVASARGLDLEAHRSRLLEAAEAASSDLVIGMAREHVRAVVLACPEAWPKTFTLKELVRRGKALGKRRPGQSLGEWLVEVGAGREYAELLGANEIDDVGDPLGRSLGTFEAAAREICELVDALVAHAWPPGVGR